MRKPILVILLMVIYLACSASTGAKDTTIDSVKYHYAFYYANGKLKALSQNKNKKEGGKWIYYGKDGQEIWRGSYDNKGEKTGQWIYKRNSRVLYSNGHQITD